MKKDCPYYQKRNKTCTHRALNHWSIKKSTPCIHNKSKKCPIFKEWLHNKLKKKSEHLERLKRLFLDNDD